MRAFSHSWFDRPRRLLMLFAVVTLVPAVGLLWLGTRLISQDRELAAKELRDKLEQRAGALASEITRDLTRPTAPTGTGRPFADDPRATDLAIRARDLRTAGRGEEALAIWASMQDMDDVHVFGEPASLQAALARVRFFRVAGKNDERAREAEMIRNDLVRGRWRIDTTSIENAWEQVASPDVLAPVWRRRWTGSGFVIHLTDLNGKPIVETGAMPAAPVTHSLADAGLPWTIRIASASPEVELAASNNRRQQLLLVLSLAAFLVMAGAYFVARGMRRELAVAELQSSFVSAVSHEFRTPLTSMSHLIELLRSRPGLDESKRARYYDALEQEAGRLRRFVDQLLDFGRVDAGKARYSLEPADPTSIVNDVVERFRAGPGARGHAVRFDANGHAAAVAVDREAFSLALNNLLENAAKYSPVEKPIEVSLDSGEGGALAVRVRDYGAGIPKGELGIIFDKFVRGSAAQASNVRGTGVGLALAREIIRAHGGDIRVDSEVSRGSTFSIVLPVTTAATGSP